MTTQQTLTADLSLTSKKKFTFDLDYQKMYYKVKNCNEIALGKLIKAQRAADYWKRHHQTLIDTLWGWTIDNSTQSKCLRTPYPREARKKKPKAAAASFTFPPKQAIVNSAPAQPPSSPASRRKQKESSSTPVKRSKRKAAEVNNDGVKQNTTSKNRIRRRLDG